MSSTDAKRVVALFAGPHLSMPLISYWTAPFFSPSHPTSRTTSRRGEVGSNGVRFVVAPLEDETVLPCAVEEFIKQRIMRNKFSNAAQLRFDYDRRIQPES